MQIRTVVAAFTAPLVGSALTVTLLVLLARDAGEAWTETAMTLGFALSLYGIAGALGAYLLEAAIGFPVYRWMQRRGSFTLGPTLLAGIAAGVLALVIPLTFLGTAWDLKRLGLTCFFGALGGASAALWFWVVSFGWRLHKGAA